MRLLLVALALTGLAGCASTGDGTSRSSRNEITPAEVEGARGVGTAADLVKRLRPQWLRTRGSGTFNPTAEEGIIVYVDGGRAGVIPVMVGAASTASAGLNPLESLSAERVGSMRYYTASEATQRFGTGHAYGAIEVLTKR